jgi:hypothetical protein
MLEQTLNCWRCGALLKELTPPIERRDECPACHAQLYVCKFCEFYDPKVARQCREPIADEVKEKSRANFCGYFKPNPHAFVPVDASSASQAKSALDALFGGETTSQTPSSSARDALDKLFGND